MHLHESQGPGRVFTQLYDGPFEVMEKISNVAYRLRIPSSYNIHPVINVTHLKKYNASDPETIRPRLKPLRESLEEYEVIRIVKQKWGSWNGRRTILFQCEWIKYGITDDWIPANYFKNAPDILRDWVKGATTSTERAARNEATLDTTIFPPLTPYST
jgi:hypothetical protein